MLTVKTHDIAIPKLGLGTWMLSGENCVKAVQHALASGYRHVDTAQIYENEAEVGNALKSAEVPRSDVFLTTKIWRDNVAAKDLAPSLETSLKHLKTDYVDLLLIHWPVEEVPFAEQMEALQKVQQQGKTRLIGVSNFTTEQLCECKEELGVDIVTNQVEYHPYLSQEPVLDFIESHDMFLTAYSPLGRSKLSGDTVLRAIASDHETSVGQVILRWHMQQPHVVAIPKSGTPAHIEANIDIFDFELSENEMMEITALTRKHQRLINPDFSPHWDEPKAA